VNAGECLTCNYGTTNAPECDKCASGEWNHDTSVDPNQKSLTNKFEVRVTTKKVTKKSSGSGITFAKNIKYDIEKAP
jgi:hypothetical protein